MLVVYYADDREVLLPEGHRFPMRKYRALRRALLEQGVVRSAQVRAAPSASRDELLAAHSPDWVEAVLSGTVERKLWRPIGLPWSPELVARTLASVGGTLAACRHALTAGIAGNLAGGTHHAGAGHGEGFCVFNDAAVALSVLLAEGAIARGAIVDLDVHQGQGNSAIFAERDEVLVVSLHGERNYPFRKIASTIDIGFPDGTGDAVYLEALSTVVPEIVGFAPQLVVYIGGVDPLEADTLGRLSLSAEGLATRDRLVLSTCKRAGIPVALTLGGGYADPIEASIAAHVTTYREAQALWT